MELIAGAGQAILGIIAAVFLLVGALCLGLVIGLAVLIAYYGDPLYLEDEPEQKTKTKRK